MIHSQNKKTKGKQFKNINRNDFIYFQNLLEQETVGGKEYLIDDMVCDKLDKLNFKWQIDSIGNIFAVRGSSKEYWILNAHRDIVNMYGGYLGYSGRSTMSNTSSMLNQFQEIQSRWKKENNISKNNYYYSALLEDINYIQKRMKRLGEKDYKREILEGLWYTMGNLDKNDLKSMGISCNSCVSGCKSDKVCNKFSLDPNNTEACNDFVNRLRDYCEEVVESFDRYYEEECNKPVEKESETNKGTKDYEVIVDLDGDRIYGRGKRRVLGGDDKAGIFIALKVAEILKDVPMKILFTVQEESGCIGISHFTKENKDFFKDVKGSLTIDRREGNNLLPSQLRTRSCSKDFEEKLFNEGVKAGINVKIMDGSIADVIHIRNFVPNSVNMSAGYYSAHSADEYIIPSDVDKIIDWVKNIVTNV